MNQNWQVKLGLIMSGAITGLVAAIRVDYKSWKTHNKDKSIFEQKDFDWKYAGKRYLEAALLGALAGIGLDILSENPIQGGSQ